MVWLKDYNIGLGKVDINKGGSIPPLIMIA